MHSLCIIYENHTDFSVNEKNCPSVNRQYDNANILIKLFSFSSHYITINMYVYLFYDFILCYR